MVNNASNTFLYFIICFIVFLMLSFFSYFGKLELYSIATEITEVTEVLFGEPTPTTYQGKQLMPNNNQTAYFVSNNTIKKQKTKKQNDYYSYEVNPLSTGDYNSQQLFLVENSMFELKLTTRKRKHEKISNTFEISDYNNIEMLGPFKLDLTSSQSELNEPFATLLETSSNEPFRISQTDPDPNEPEGEALPLAKDLTILLLLAGVYALKKHFKHSKPTLDS